MPSLDSSTPSILQSLSSVTNSGELSQSALLICLWWVQGIVISFFPSEFTASVNGYFSLWASVAVAFYYALTIHGPPGVVSPAFQPISQTEGGWPGFSQPLAPAE